MIASASNKFRFVNMALTGIAVWLSLTAWMLVQGETGLQERLLLTVVVLLTGFASTGRPALECRRACYQLQTVRAISIATTCTLGAVILTWWVASVPPSLGQILTIELAATLALTAGFCLTVCATPERGGDASCPVPRQLTRTERAVKRAFDIVIALFALACVLPVMVACAIAIRLESPGPIIYRQRRYTTDGRLFVLYKFRSMRSDPEPSGEIRLTDRNDGRVTRVGAFLRRTSVDEIPQFLNVLQGHMSVVGPRPHPPGVKVGDRVYEEVITNFADRYVVKPGITGWAQVSGLRGNTFTERHLEERFSADLEYIRNWSLSLEILIIIKTICGGFAGKNAF